MIDFGNCDLDNAGIINKFKDENRLIQGRYILEARYDGCPQYDYVDVNHIKGIHLSINGHEELTSPLDDAIDAYAMLRRTEHGFSGVRINTCQAVCYMCHIRPSDNGIVVQIKRDFTYDDGSYMTLEEVIADLDEYLHEFADVHDIIGYVHLKDHTFTLAGDEYNLYSVIEPYKSKTFNDDGTCSPTFCDDDADGLPCRCKDNIYAFHGKGVNAKSIYSGKSGCSDIIKKLVIREFKIWDANKADKADKTDSPKVHSINEYKRLEK